MTAIAASVPPSPRGRRSISATAADALSCDYALRRRLPPTPVTGDFNDGAHHCRIRELPERSAMGADLFGRSLSAIIRRAAHACHRDASASTRLPFSYIKLASIISGAGIIRAVLFIALLIAGGSFQGDALTNASEAIWMPGMMMFIGLSRGWRGL